MIIFVLYNVMTVPMDIGLDLPNNSYRKWFENFIDLFFICDVTLNFFTGYIDGNRRLIMNQKKIIKNYMKLWFWIDIVASFPFDIIMQLFGKSSDGSNIKLLALLKTPRLLRIGRILKFLEHIKGANIMRIANLFIFFFILCH